MGDASVSQLAEPFDISQPAISRHLKVLEAAGLVTRGQSAQWRPSRLSAEPLRELDSWLDDYRTFWSESLGRLDEYLAELQRDPINKPENGDPS